MPWVLTRGNDGAEIGYRVAGFISEWWPTSNRNGDRHRLGKGGRHASESATRRKFRLKPQLRPLSKTAAAHCFHFDFRKYVEYMDGKHIACQKCLHPSR